MASVTSTPFTGHTLPHLEHEITGELGNGRSVCGIDALGKGAVGDRAVHGAGVEPFEAQVLSDQASQSGLAGAGWPVDRARRWGSLPDFFCLMPAVPGPHAGCARVLMRVPGSTGPGVLGTPGRRSCTASQPMMCDGPAVTDAAAMAEAIAMRWSPRALTRPGFRAWTPVT